MNPEILGVATAAGYVVGQVAEQHARTIINNNRGSALMATEGAGHDARRFGGLSRLITPLALAGAIAGYSLAAGFGPNSGSSSEATAMVTTVVDHDYISSTDGVASLENVIADSFDSGDTSISDHLITAHNGTSDHVSPDSLKSDIPDGPASVEATMISTLSVDFSAAPKAQTNLLTNVNDKSGAEVVMIDSTDVISDPEIASIESSSKSAGHIPIYVLDISGKGQPPATRANIQKMALKTGGNYWDVSPTNYQTILAKMESSIKPHDTTHEPGGDTLPYKVIGIAVTGLGAYMYTRRKSETAVS